MFNVNLAGWDRWARIVAGLLVVSLAFWGPKTPWAWLGLVLVATGFLSFCPIYALLGIRTGRAGRR